VVATFFLSAGVYRLARRQALVRRAVAEENIGRVSGICADTTGTKTEGRMAKVHRLTAAGLGADWLRGLAALAGRGDGGDPLDEAILALVAPAVERAPGPLRVFPFTEARRRETALWPAAGGTVQAVTKGAPETVLALCTLAPEEADAWRDRVAGHAAAGHKVIAFASRALQA